MPLGEELENLWNYPKATPGFGLDLWGGMKIIDWQPLGRGSDAPLPLDSLVDGEWKCPRKMINKTNTNTHRIIRTYLPLIYNRNWLVLARLGKVNFYVHFSSPSATMCRYIHEHISLPGVWRYFDQNKINQVHILDAVYRYDEVFFNSNFNIKISYSSQKTVGHHLHPVRSTFTDHSEWKVSTYLGHYITVGILISWGSYHRINNRINKYDKKSCGYICTCLTVPFKTGTPLCIGHINRL